MCGIAGSVNYSFADENIFRSMRHRGPDEQGSYAWNNVQFYHLRLSIIDIACGKQPMHFADRYCIIFNGEIFNHTELREKYQLQGNTNSDTETLLLLYDKLGMKLLDELDGMFVFVILDKTKNKLFIARDRAGIKPLYYYYDTEKFVFASELNGLKSIVPLEINAPHFFNYLRLGSFFRSETPYKNVHELEAGTWLSVDADTCRLEVHPWWNIRSFYAASIKDPLEVVLEKADEILHRSVKRRIESSDIEVGTFLSGGIDSGLVTSVASAYHPGIKTFTVSFKGEYNEAPLARLVAEKYHTEHHEIAISFEHLQNDVEKILGNYGEPFFDSSAIPSYYVSKAAKEFVTVILNGDGADELFGGYRRYVPFSKFDFFRSNPLIRSFSRAALRVLPASNDKKSLYNYGYRLLDFSSKDGLGIYLSAGVDIFEGYTKYLLNEYQTSLSPVRAYFEKIQSSDISGLKKIMNLDFDINLFDDLLIKMDIATMANSQEGRSPFLCKEFLEYIPGLPDEYKIRGKTTKFLLRKLAEKYLPASLIHQPKRGFEIPLKKWVDHELKEIIDSYLHTSGPFYQRFVQKDFIYQVLDKKVKMPEEKRAKLLWTIFSMELWFQRVYKG